jgi:hypothetical protein
MRRTMITKIALITGVIAALVAVVEAGCKWH